MGRILSGVGISCICSLLSEFRDIVLVLRDVSLCGGGNLDEKDAFRALAFWRAGKLGKGRKN